MGVLIGFWEVKFLCLFFFIFGFWWFYIVFFEIYVKKYILSLEVFYIIYFFKKYSVYYIYIESFFECLLFFVLIRFRAGNKVGLGFMFFGEVVDMKIKLVNLFELNLIFRKYF